MAAERDYPPIANLDDYIEETQMLKEMQALFDLQNSRYGQSRVVWQLVTGNENVWPDLGKLLEWLMDHLDRDKLAHDLHVQKRPSSHYDGFRNCDECYADIDRILTKGVE